MKIKGPELWVLWEMLPLLKGTCAKGASFFRSELLYIALYCPLQRCDVNFLSAVIWAQSPKETLRVTFSKYSLKPEAKTEAESAACFQQLICLKRSPLLLQHSQLKTTEVRNILPSQGMGKGRVVLSEHF